MDNISVVSADRETISRAAAVLSEAFRDEKITGYIFNPARKNVAATLARLHALKAEYSLRTGQAVLLAVSADGIAVGAALLTRKTRPSLRTAVAVYFPRAPFLVLQALVRADLRRALAVKRALRLPVKIPGVYYTLEGIGVAARFRGRKVGRKLLETVHRTAQADPAASGIYLLTGEEKNRLLYEHMGYRTIHQEKAREMTIHHMFRENSRFHRPPADA